MYWLWQNIKQQFAEEQNRWFLWMPVLFGTGIGFYFLLPHEPLIWWTLGVIETLIVLAVVFRFRPHILAWLSVIAMLVLGFTDIQLKAYYLSHRPELLSAETTYVRGRVSKVDYNYRGNLRLRVEDAEDFDGERFLGNIKVTLRDKDFSVRPGECVELAAKLLPRPQTSMPGGYQFDRKAYFDEISANGYALSQAYKTDCLAEASLPDRFRWSVDDLRNRIIAKINNVLPPDEASIAAAIIAGEQGGVKREIIQNYRDSGLAHFLSISGLHMSMIAGLMFFLVRLLISFVPPLAIRYDSKKPAAVFAILISAFYLLISGAAVPSQRAFIMTFIVVLGIFFDRRAISMKTISVAALIILILSPQALIGVSFQMSFAAVVALVAFYEKYAGALRQFWHGDGKGTFFVVRFFKCIVIYLVGVLTADLVASLATMPFAVYHFNRIAVYTTLANLLAGPIIGFVIMPFVLLSLLLMPLGLDVLPLKIVGLGIAQVNAVTSWVSGLPGAGYQIVSMPLWGLLLIVFGGLWVCLWNMPWRKWGWGLIFCGLLNVFTVAAPDVLIDADAEVFAVKDNSGNLVVFPGNGNEFIKQLWLEKSAGKKMEEEQQQLLKAIYQGEKVDTDWLDLFCDEQSCIYKKRFKYYKKHSLEIDGEIFDVQAAGGAAFYLNNDVLEMKTVRDFTGRRYWNKSID